MIVFMLFNADQTAFAAMHGPHSLCGPCIAAITGD